jgi:uncharacterized protein YhaN
MRFERVELDGFGRFHQASWPLDDGLTVVVGANEAGKTTFLNAIRALLFGFEATRDGRTWYPAFAGGRRGGRLVIRTGADERWTVERFGERGGGGSLAVHAPNGNRGGQETLDRLMRGADKDLFNNIFAFGLGELQNIHSLSTEAVRGRIYGASAGLGGTSAVDIERDLRAGLRDTFVPSGTKPPLNDLLARIERLRAEIADLAHQPAEYDAAHAERNALRERSEALRAEIHACRERLNRHARLRSAGPIAAELAAIEAELEQGDVGLDTLPEDAVAVLNGRVAALDSAREQLSMLDQQLDEARNARAVLRVDDRILAAADEIAALGEERAMRAGAVDRRRDLVAAIAASSASVEEQLARAGGWDEARLVGLDDSIAAVEATRAHERELQLATAAASEAEQRRRSAAEELELREAEAGSRGGTDDDGLDRRAAAYRQLDALRVRRATAETTSGMLSVTAAAWITTAMVAIGALAGALVSQPLAGAVAGAVLGGLVLVVARRSAGGGSEALEAERARLLNALALPPDATDGDIVAAGDAMATERARRQMASELDAGLNARRTELERRARDADLAAAALDAARQRWAAWLADHGLPGDASGEAARQLLSAAGSARRASLERDSQRARLEELDRQDEAFGARAGALLTVLGVERPADALRREALIVNLVTRLDRARDESRRCQELEATTAQLDERRAPVAAAVAERQELLADHLAALGCDDPDTARLRAAAAAERRSTRARVRELQEQLAVAAGSAEAVGPLLAESAGVDPDQLEADRAQAEEDLARLEAEDREAANQIGALDARIRQLEAAEELGTKRQQLVVVEGQAATMAREWAVRAIALRLLEETRSRYERERQPDVVRAAEAHFERFTGGRYTRIVAAPGDANVRVETEGGEGRVTDELSRGTAEQLYLALRFGLIEEFAGHAEPLPVVMDDILVNFDASRAASAAGAIRDLAARHQVLYFTCHRWTAELLDPDGGRTLSLD